MTEGLPEALNKLTLAEGSDPTVAYYQKLLTLVNKYSSNPEIAQESQRRIQTKIKCYQEKLSPSNISPSKSVVFLTHFGLGDMITTNGAVRYLSTHYDKVWVLCFYKYADNLRLMYSDDKTIVIVPVEGEIITGDGVYKLAALAQSRAKQLGASKIILSGGLYFPDRRWKGPYGCERFYECVNLPYSARFDYEYLSRNPEEEEKVYQEIQSFFGGDKEHPVDYGVFHDDPTRDLVFPKACYGQLREHQPRWVIPREPHPQDVNITDVKIYYAPQMALMFLPKVLEEAKALVLLDSSFFCLALVCNLKAKHKVVRHRGAEHVSAYYVYHPKVAREGWVSV